MNIQFDNRLYLDGANRVLLNKSYENGNAVYADIYVLSSKFTEYQKDLINEFLGSLNDAISMTDGFDLEEFRHSFENMLQELNSKLNIFADKIKDVERMPLKGIVQIYVGNNYMASMIGEVSVVIFRNGSLNYIVDNDFDEETKIDTFSEFIEGELESDDKILVVGIKVSDIFDKRDIEDALHISINEDKDILDVFEELITVRISKEVIGFVCMSHVTIDLMNAKIPSKERFSSLTSKFNMVYSFKDLLLKFRFPIVISLGVLVILFLAYSFMTINFGKNNVTDTGDGVVVVDYTIEDIKKDIDLFIKIPATSDEKAKKYEEILKKISILEKKNKWPEDINDLKSLLNVEYYKGFNIVMMNTLDEKIYGFTEDEKTAMGNMNTLLSKDGLIIGGTKGAVVGAVNDSIRGKVINYNVPKDMVGCSSNLLGNGIYCFSSSGDVFNVTKSLESIISDSGSFPSDIQSIKSFDKRNFYTLVNGDSILKNDGFITKYNNVVGSQTKFGKGVPYILDQKFMDQHKADIASGFSDFAIDGSILAWSRGDRNLYQFYKDGNNVNRSGRIIELRGGSKIGNGFSQNVKIMTNEDTNSVFLFDRDSSLFTVYRSSPYKTNSQYKNNYNLNYFFSIKFDLQGVHISDVYTDMGEKPVLYVLTDSGVYKIKLYDFFQSFGSQSKK